MKMVQSSLHLNQHQGKRGQYLPVAQATGKWRPEGSSLGGKGFGMGRLITAIMYVLWILTIVAVLVTTFTNFQYEDLNILALVFFVFALLNSFFSATKK